MCVTQCIVYCIYGYHICSHGLMFWSDSFENIIYQANLDGNDIRILLNESQEVVGMFYMIKTTISGSVC